MCKDISRSISESFLQAIETRYRSYYINVYRFMLVQVFKNLVIKLTIQNIKFNYILIKL